jgi:ribosome-binding protein aMBF1 (putative translation factor)
MCGCLAQFPILGNEGAVPQPRFVNKGDAAYQRAYQAFLKRLIKARHDAGYLQEEVARRLGKPHSFISKCELGERRLDIIELQRIAKIYGKTIGYFLGDD